MVESVDPVPRRGSVAVLAFRAPELLALRGAAFRDALDVRAPIRLDGAPGLVRS